MLASEEGFRRVEWVKLASSVYEFIKYEDCDVSAICGGGTGSTQLWNSFLVYLISIIN